MTFFFSNSISEFEACCEIYPYHCSSKVIAINLYWNIIILMININ